LKQQTKDFDEFIKIFGLFIKSFPRFE